MKTLSIPLLSYVVGALLIATGLLAIGTYVDEAIAVWNASDRSMLYWLLFLPLIGVGLVGAGLGFVVIGRKARRDPSARALAGHCLLGLGILSAALAIAGHFRHARVAKSDRNLEQHLQLRAQRDRNARKLDRLDLDFAGNESIIVHAQPSAGLDGRYRWTLKISNGQNVLLESSRELTLQGTAPPIVQRTSFAQWFAKCFDPAPSAAYACVHNAEASESYLVQGNLELIDDAHGSVASTERRYNPIVATASRELSLDTRTTDDAVVVMGVAQPRP